MAAKFNQVKPVKGLSPSVADIKVLQDIRPDGFTFNVLHNEISANASINGSVSTGVFSFPYPSLLKSLAIVTYIIDPPERFVIPPEDQVVLLSNGVLGSENNPGFFRLDDLGNFNANFNDSPFYVHSGNDNHKDLSSLGLIYNELQIEFAARIDDPVYVPGGGTWNMSITLRFERVNR